MVTGKKLKNLFKDFIDSHNDYQLVDIIIDYYDVIKTANIALILLTEKDKESFLLNKFDQCKKELSKVIDESNLIKVQTYAYMVLSKEEVDKRYNGSYYYAMK